MKYLEHTTRKTKILDLKLLPILLGRKVSGLHTEASKNKKLTQMKGKRCKNDIALVANTTTKETPVNCIPPADVAFKNSSSM